MTEELLKFYKRNYNHGGILYRLPKDDRLNIIFTPQAKHISQHIFPEYEYSRNYALKFLKRLKK
jgi:hypothetical protein